MQIRIRMTALQTEGSPVEFQHKRLDLDLVVKPLGEQRSQRPIDQTRGQRLLHRRSALAFEKTAGKLAGRRSPLAIVASQRKKIDAHPRRSRRHRTQNDRFTILHQTTTSRLLSQHTGFEGQRTGPNLLLYAYFRSTHFSFLRLCRAPSQTLRSDHFGKTVHSRLPAADVTQRAGTFGREIAPRSDVGPPYADRNRNYLRNCRRFSISRYF